MVQSVSISLIVGHTPHKLHVKQGVLNKKPVIGLKGNAKQPTIARL
jgi:hypothetical protein